MGLGDLALAAVLLLAWTGGSTAFPLIPLQARISLQSQDRIEAVRWRHRHRGHAWAEQGDDTGGTVRSFTAEKPSATPEVVPPDLGRRYHRGRFGVGGAVQTATRPVASLSMVQIVSALLTWSGPILVVAADG
mgnify:CR=1 FL=1